MLKIVIPDREYLNPDTYEFIKVKGQTVQLEHSLISLSKWESKWQIPFLDVSKEHTREQTLDYIRCMSITPNVNPNVYLGIDAQTMKLINSYINDKMTATTFNKHQQGNKVFNREIITSELIYYWMIALNIPFECQKWHLNRLLTLIEICNIKNTPPKKMSRKELGAQWASINAARRAKLGSKG